MKKLLATITVAVTLVASSASAFDPKHLKMLKDIGECLNCDLSDANLSDANLNGAFLRNAEMSYARMNDVILCNTTMPDCGVIDSGC